MRHPRGAGMYARVLGWLTLPADRLKLAELVLFDPAAVSDRATFQNLFALAVGIRKVMVKREAGLGCGQSNRRDAWRPIAMRPR